MPQGTLRLKVRRAPPEQPLSMEARVGKLHLTYRMMRMLRSVCAVERNRRNKQAQRDEARGWRPEPGHGNANVTRALAMEDIIRQLNEQIAAEEERCKREQ